MTYPDRSPAMNQRIFNINLPVQTVSLYLLCCGLVDSGKELSKKIILGVWNGSEEAFIQSMNELKKRKIIMPVSHEVENDVIYELLDPDHWRIF